VGTRVQCWGGMGQMTIQVTKQIRLRSMKKIQFPKGRTDLRNITQSLDPLISFFLTNFHMDQKGILIQWRWLGKLQKQVAKEMCCSGATG